jgi:hypothetical protein
VLKFVAELVVSELIKRRHVHIFWEIHPFFPVRTKVILGKVPAFAIFRVTAVLKKGFREFSATVAIAIQFNEIRINGVVAHKAITEAMACTTEFVDAIKFQHVGTSSVADMFSINFLIEFTSHAVVRGPSLTPFGKRPERTPAHQAESLIGKTCLITGKRTNPASGSAPNGD